MQTAKIIVFCIHFAKTVKLKRNFFLLNNVLQDGTKYAPQKQSQTYKTFIVINVSKGAKIRNQYNQVPHLTQDTNWKVTNSQLDTTNESQEVSHFPAGDQMAHINSQRHSKHKTGKT